MNWIKTIITILLLWLASIVNCQNCETLFDLSTWTKQGTPLAYWKIISPTQVIDTTWLFPATFFVSPNEMINVKIRGTVMVTKDTDDDFIGLVFGYKTPTQLDENNTYNFYLFDWKSDKDGSSTSNSHAGFRLSYYNGYFTRDDQHKYFEGAVHNPPLRSLLKTKYGYDLRWEPTIEYELELLYTSNTIQVSVDSTLIFELEGSFSTGKFGFYCMSQAYVTFKDFTYQQSINFYPSQESACINQNILFYPYDQYSGNLPNFINTISWDFGDGTTSTETIPSHSYNINGTYDVKLIVLKDDGCEDTIIKNVTIYADPIVDLGNDIEMPACSTLILEAANPGSSYLWSTGETTETIELINVPKDTAVWVVVSKYGCTGSDTVLIKVEEIQYQLYFPNAFTPNNDGKNDLFAPVGRTDNVAIYQLVIYNRWGQQVFESSNPDVGWDGKYNGNLSTIGTYIYKVSYRIENCSGKEDYSKLTTLTLIN